MKGKARRELLESATACDICGQPSSISDPFTVFDPLAGPVFVPFDAPMPQRAVVHRSCKPKVTRERGIVPSVTAWGRRGWHNMLGDDYDDD